MAPMEVQAMNPMKNRDDQEGHESRGRFAVSQLETLIAIVKPNIAFIFHDL
jgi:hypothetical protein